MVATSQHGKLSCCFFRASREPGTSQNGSALFNHCATKRSWSENIYFHLCLGSIFFQTCGPTTTDQKSPGSHCLVTWSQARWQLCSQVVCKPLENAVPSAESCLHIDQGLTRTWTRKLYLPILKRINLWGAPNWRQAAFAREWVAQGLRPECVAEAEESTRNPWPDVFFAKVDLRFRL